MAALLVTGAFRAAPKFRTIFVYSETLRVQRQGQFGLGYTLRVDDRDHNRVSFPYMI
jgi:hypothetical protein